MNAFFIKKRRRFIEQLGWLVNRLSCMTVSEILYRVKHIYVNKAIKYGVLTTEIPKPTKPIHPIATRVIDCSTINREPYLQEIDAMLTGHVLLFANRSFNVGRVPEWNRDVLTGILAPLSFSLDIPITHRHVVGDIKHIWELNRHSHLVRFAQVYVLTGEQCYLDVLIEQINSWLEQCPPLRGPNWTSSLELGIRLVNWSLIWEILGGYEGVLFKNTQGILLRTQWLNSIFAHCQFITRHISKHSSANNHLIGELAGLYIATHVWPYWDQFKDWRGFAKVGLEREVMLQHSIDGVNKEQAFAYQVFTLEFFIVAGICGQRNTDAFTENYWRMIYKSLRFLRSVCDTAGHVPMVGDADDGIVLRFEPGENQDRVAMILALGDALFADKAVTHSTDTVKWLLGTEINFLPKQICFLPTDWQFPNGGYLLFGSDFNKPREIKGLVDCGALGYLGIAAHGHADALSLTLSVGGEELLVDSGTFSYWNDLKWRDYFRGTSAHNTVCVDGLDQSVSGGRFMWTRKARTTIDKMPSSPKQFYFSGHHDGYMRLTDSIRHVRSIRYDEETMQLVVHDVVSGKVRHEVEQFWHFDENLQITLEEHQVSIKGQRFNATMWILGCDLEIELFYGDENIPLGWMSRTYEAKQPIHTLRVRTLSRLASIEARLKITFLV